MQHNVLQSASVAIGQHKAVSSNLQKINWKNWWIWDWLTDTHSVSQSVSVCLSVCLLLYPMWVSGVGSNVAWKERMRHGRTPHGCARMSWVCLLNHIRSKSADGGNAEAVHGIGKGGVCGHEGNSFERARNNSFVIDGRRTKPVY